MTQIFESVEQWRNYRNSSIKAGSKLGFVPTMGALHEGHTSLFKRAKAENDLVLASIFVNPAQFNDLKDLERYPRTLDKDVQILSDAGVDFLLYPKSHEIYADEYRYRVHEEQFSKKLCGAHRPGHFEGVLTVVLKLLNIARADKAYFGEKDFQQLSLIQGMTSSFFLHTEIVACPTVRESDGLAMSSRNMLLNDEQRAKAPKFASILGAGLTLIETRKRLADEGFLVDYVEDLVGRRFGAVKLGDVRLIDNIRLEEKQL